MQARWIVTSLIAVSSAPALAQSPAVLGRDDAAFARLLYDTLRYPDLAEKLCAVIEKNGQAKENEVVGVRALHLDLRLDLARAEPDLFKRKDMIKSVLQEKEELIGKYRGTKEAQETSNTLPDVYQKLGETLTAAIQKTTDVGLVKQLQDEGHKYYVQAQESLAARIESLKDDHADPAAEQQYIAALYNLPRTYYFHSLLYPTGEWLKKDLLEKAVVKFQEFGLDYADTILNYEGMIYTGLCDKDLGQPQDALRDFDDAIALRELFEVDAKGVFALNVSAADTVSAAVLQKVLLQIELKDFAGAAETAKKYFATTPAPLETRSGFAVLAAQADAELGAGDTKAAGETAQQLVDADERGPWGAKGRDIQSKMLAGPGGGSLGTVDLLKIAQSLVSRGDTTRALQVCHQAISAARGSEKEANAATDAYLQLGLIYSQRGWINEAALAFDTAADRYPASDKAPEAVYQALQAYVRLNGDEKKAFYKKRIDERMKLLATKYASSPRAAFAQLVEGQQLEAEGNFLKAAELYGKVTPGSPSYLEAQFRTGSCFFMHARKLFGEKKNDEAKQYVTQAETLLKKAVSDLDAAMKSTLDLESQGRYEKLGFTARMKLAELYLTAGVNRPADVLPMLEGAEERYASDADKLSKVWGKRIEALQAQGKLDEAVKLLDSLAKKDPNSPAVGPAAGLVARALDQKATDTAAKDARAADEIWKRAANYYSMSGRALLKSDTPRSSEVEAIANRLYALGLHFNGVPDTQDTFLGWSGGRGKDTSLWQQAAELYDAALKVSPSYLTQINLGRIQGFLGKWADASADFGQLFDTETLIDRETKKFSPAVLRSKPQLVTAYLEWGVAEHEAALLDSDQDRYSRAATIFENMVNNLDAKTNPKLWWFATYYQIKSLYDTGKYEQANIAMNNVVRTNSSLGGETGLKDAFTKLKDDLSKKNFPLKQQAASPTPSAPVKPK